MTHKLIPFAAILVLLSHCVGGWAQEAEQPIPKMSVDEAIKALGSADAETSHHGLVCLATAGREEAKRAVPAIVEIIKTKAPNVPNPPMGLLEFLGPEAEDAVPAIVANLEKYAPDVQHSFLHVLVAIGPKGKAAVPSLMKITTSQDFHCRYLAYRALGKIGPASKPAVGVLIKGLESDGASGRRNAAEALGRLGAEVAPEAVPALIKAMNDSLAPIRDEAVRAIGNFGKLAEPAIPELRKIVKDVNSTQRAEAGMSLWILTEDVDFILPRMIEHLEFGDLEWEAAEVLAAMGPAAAPAVPGLIDALQRDASVQLPVIKALGNIGPNAKPALPALRKLLDSEEPAVRTYAEEAIKKIEQAEAEETTADRDNR